ncbi:MAG: decaprenyl-phosphate phosphoribosyltransferase [Acidimicrobiales bacterium]
MTTSLAQERRTVRALVSAMRPSQWLKNGLVAIAPAAAHSLTHADVLLRTSTAFIAFCFMASGIYLINDLRDAQSDRQHPTKRFRAIASGELSTRTALTSAFVLTVIAFAIPFALSGSHGLLLILGLYFVVSISYSLWLKSLAIIELGVVASGFFLRAYAGAVTSHIPVSTWFLVVISFGALFLVVGKRTSELKRMGANVTRPVLTEYSLEFLRSALTLSATVVVAGYCLWAFDTTSTGLSSTYNDFVPIRLSVVPVVFAVLFIMRSAEAGDGAAPEELLLRDRTVQALALIWVLLMAWGVYG